jgi:catechol 2,3-dioxygenase-like lactoylglutathione lyase family enzyme
MGLELTLMCIVLDSSNSEELSDFYQRLLGWKRRNFDSNTEFITVFDEKNKGMPWLLFQNVENYVRPVWPAESGKPQQMTHLDFHVEDIEKGVAHALSCGATLSPIQLADSWRVMLDPAGHPFCICPTNEYIRKLIV